MTLCHQRRCSDPCSDQNKMHQLRVPTSLGWVPGHSPWHSWDSVSKRQVVGISEECFETTWSVRSRRPKSGLSRYWSQQDLGIRNLTRRGWRGEMQTFDVSPLAGSQQSDLWFGVKSTFEFYTERQPSTQPKPSPVSAKRTHCAS